MPWYGDRPCPLGLRVVWGDGFPSGFREPRGGGLLTWVPVGCRQPPWCEQRRADLKAGVGGDGRALSSCVVVLAGAGLARCTGARTSPQACCWQPRSSE